jgi:hypothetical protein
MRHSGREEGSREGWGTGNHRLKSLPYHLDKHGSKDRELVEKSRESPLHMIVNKTLMMMMMMMMMMMR